MTSDSRWLGLIVLGACGYPLLPPVDVGCVAPQPVTCTPATGSAGSLPRASLRLAMEETDPAAAGTDSAGHPVQCVTGQCPVIARGIHGNGRWFAGQQLQVDWAPDLDGSAGYTVGAWACLDAAPPRGGYACALAQPNRSDASGDGNSYALCVDDGQRIYNYTTVGSTSDMLTGQAMAVREWHHIAASWNATARTKILYVDGCRANDSQPGDIRFDRGPLVVGADLKLLAGGVPAYFWSGVLDDVVFYSRALDDAEIKLLAAP